ncbi:MAG TPA: hypothetical protein VLA12_12090 [Planctomycetaceae bacterium]|nr:hypothetical protein [Planctomycetaceae bacterium]
MMRFTFSLAVFLLALSGCNSATSPDDFAGDYAEHLNQVADVLSNVKHRDDADTAAGKVESLLSDATSLQEQARNLTEQGKLGPEVEAKLKQATDRIGSEISRLRTGNLVTPKLQSALEQFESSAKATLDYAKAGALPAPETPLEEAYVEYVQVVEDLADASAKVNDLASAQARLSEFQAIGQRRNEVLIRIGKAGGEQPPFGTPEKYRAHMNAAQKRSEQSDARLNGLADVQAIIDLLGPAIAISDEAQQAFRLDAGIRSAGAENIVTVTLRNNKVLPSEQHQLMSQMIKQAAAAQKMEAVIDGDIYRVVLSPVPDMQGFISRLNLGTVSDVDPANRSFVLTIDPAKVPAVAENVPPFGPGGRPGFPPRTNESVGPVPSGTLTSLDTQKIEQTRTAILNQEQAANVVEIYFKNGRPFVGPRMGKALGVVSRTTGARLLRPVPLQSGDGYFFFHSDKKMQELADAFDLGKIESVDETTRKLVLTLEESKVPE